MAIAVAPQAVAEPRVLAPERDARGHDHVHDRVHDPGHPVGVVVAVEVGRAPAEAALERLDLGLALAAHLVGARPLPQDRQVAPEPPLRVDEGGDRLRRRHGAPPASG